MGIVLTLAFITASAGFIYSVGLMYRLVKDNKSRKGRKRN